MHNEGESALILTNRDAPMFKLIRVNLRNPTNVTAWETIIAENDRNKLDWVSIVAENKMIVAYLEDVKV